MSYSHWALSKYRIYSYMFANIQVCSFVLTTMQEIAHESMTEWFANLKRSFICLFKDIHNFYWQKKQMCITYTISRYSLSNFPSHSFICLYRVYQKPFTLDGMMKFLLAIITQFYTYYSGIRLIGTPRGIDICPGCPDWHLSGCPE